MKFNQKNKEKSMKLKLLALLAVLLTTNTQAAVRFFNTSGLDLGAHNDVKCSTGVTCTVSSGKLNIVSSPTLVGPLTLEDGEILSNAADVVSLTFDDAAAELKLVGFEATNSSLTLQADESDDSGDDWKLTSVASNNTFTISNDSSGSQVAKLTIAASTGNVSLVGALAGDGGDALSGFLQKQVAATATTITAAQCGSTFINAGAVQMELPEASAVLGCRLTFITGNASNFDVNPDNADQILVQTNAVGDAVRNATLGNAITLEAISASQWAPVAVSGTWSDIN